MFKKILIGILAVIFLLPLTASAQDTLESCQDQYGNERSKFYLYRCIGRVAAAQGDPDLCPKDPSGYSACIPYVAEALNRPDLCMDLDNGQNNALCVGRIAAEQDSPQICNILDDNLERHVCLGWAAFYLKDQRACELMDSKKNASKDVIERRKTKEDCLVGLPVKASEPKTLGVIVLLIILASMCIYLHILALKKSGYAAIYLLGSQPIVLLIGILALGILPFSPAIAVLNGGLLSLLFLTIYSLSAHVLIRGITEWNVRHASSIRKLWISAGMMIAPLPIAFLLRPLGAIIVDFIDFSIPHIPAGITWSIIILGPFGAPLILTIILWGILKERHANESITRVTRNIAWILFGTLLVYLVILCTLYVIALAGVPI